MNQQLLLALLTAAFVTTAAAQSSPSGPMSQEGAISAIEAGRDSSVNTQATATQDEANTAASMQMPVPTDTNRAEALAPTMEIQYWQAGAGAAKGAENAAKSAQVPMQRVPVNTLDAELRQESTQ